MFLHSDLGGCSLSPPVYETVSLHLFEVSLAFFGALQQLDSAGEKEVRGKSPQVE